MEAKQIRKKVARLGALLDKGDGGTKAEHKEAVSIILDLVAGVCVNLAIIAERIDPLGDT